MAGNLTAWLCLLLRIILFLTERGVFRTVPVLRTWLRVSRQCIPAESYVCTVPVRPPPSYVWCLVPAVPVSGLMGLFYLSGVLGPKLCGTCILFGLWLLIILSLNILAVVVRPVTRPILFL